VLDLDVCFTGLDPSTYNPVICELYGLSTRPCLLFIRWHQSANPEVCEQEAGRLSFITVIQEMAAECKDFLFEKRAFGNAVPSTALEEWFNHKNDVLNKADKQVFLFDPTIIVVGLLRHMRSDIQQEHKFDIDIDEMVLIPFIFIATWEKSLQSKLEGSHKELVVQFLLQS